MKKIRAFFQSKYPAIIGFVILLGFILFCVGFGIFYGIVNVINHWDSTNPNGCNYSGTHIISTGFCVLGKFIGMGLLAGFFGAFAPVMLLIAIGIFPLYLLLMALLMIPLSINKYFFKKEKVKTEVQISVALILVVGFYYFIILDKDLSRPFEILFITLGGDVLYLYRIFLNVFIY